MVLGFGWLRLLSRFGVFVLRVVWCWFVICVCGFSLVYGVVFVLMCWIGACLVCWLVVVWCCSLWCLFGCCSVLDGVNSVLVCSFVWVAVDLLFVCYSVDVNSLFACVGLGLVGVCFACYFGVE